MATSHEHAWIRLVALMLLASLGAAPACESGGVVMTNESQVPHESAVTFFDGEFTELFVVTTAPPGRELVSVQFFERRPDLGEVERLKQVAWGTPLPDGARPFAAASGLLRNEINAFWTGWRDATHLNALSVFQEEPVRVAVAEDDVLGLPPVVVPGARMHQYFWRQELGWSLYRHEFTGDLDSTGGVTTVRLRDGDARPLLARVAPVPGSHEGHVVVAWLEETAAGLAASAVRYPDGIEVRQSIALLPGETVLDRQRLALHVSSDGEVGASYVSRLEDDGFRAIEVVFDFNALAAATESTPLSVKSNTSLLAAQVFYYLDSTDRARFVCTLDETGMLVLQKPGSDHVRVIRDDASASYEFPILTSQGAAYEVRVDQHGVMTLETLP